MLFLGVLHNSDLGKRVGIANSCVSLLLFCSYFLKNVDCDFHSADLRFQAIVLFL